MDTTIKYYRKRLKIKQSELAEKLGITVTDMSFIENKKLYPNPNLAELVSHTLNVPIGTLWSEEELNLIIFKSKVESK